MKNTKAKGKSKKAKVKKKALNEIGEGIGDER